MKRLCIVLFALNFAYTEITAEIEGNWTDGGYYEFGLRHQNLWWNEAKDYCSYACAYLFKDVWINISSIVNTTCPGSWHIEVSLAGRVWKCLQCTHYTLLFHAEECKAANGFICQRNHWTQWGACTNGSMNRTRSRQGIVYGEQCHAATNCTETTFAVATATLSMVPTTALETTSIPSLHTSVPESTTTSSTPPYSTLVTITTMPSDTSKLWAFDVPSFAIGLVTLLLPVVALCLFTYKLLHKRKNQTMASKFENPLQSSTDVVVEAADGGESNMQSSERHYENLVNRNPKILEHTFAGTSNHVHEESMSPPASQYENVHRTSDSIIPTPPLTDNSNFGAYEPISHGANDQDSTYPGAISAPKRTAGGLQMNLRPIVARAETQDAPQTYVSMFAMKRHHSADDLSEREPANTPALVRHTRKTDEQNGAKSFGVALRPIEMKKGGDSPKSRNFPVGKKPLMPLKPRTNN